VSTATAVVPAYICTPRDAAWLARGVEALLREAAVERVVVVDDHSPCPPPPLAPPVEVIRSSRNAGPAAARNRGIARALERGSLFVLFTDHDCLCQPGWAEALLRGLEAGHVAASGVTRALGTTLLDRYQDFAGSMNGRWVLPGRETLIYGPSCNLAVRAEALRTERFDERFPTAAGEDYDFCHRLRRQGTIAFVPRAVVLHDFGYPGALRGLPAFLRQVRRYGAADALLWEKHPELRALPSEACAPADLLGSSPSPDPARYRRAALSRVRPRRLRPAFLVLRQLARAAYRRGQRAPDRWRALPAVASCGGAGAS